MTNLGLQFLCWIVSHTVLSQPAMPEKPPDTAARALATAMLVHDKTIRSARWSQTIVHNASDGERYPCQSVQGFDAKGRWFCAYEDIGRLRSDGRKVRGKGRVSSDGITVIGLDDIDKSGTVSEYRNQPSAYLGFDCWLGRHIDYQQHRRLGELLLNSKDLVVLSSDPPRIQGTVALAGRVSVVEVELDIDHGASPKAITVRDAALRVPLQSYQVDEFIEVAGRWLPRKASLRTRKIDIATDQMQAFQKALEREGLARYMDYSDKAVQAAYHRVVKEVFGQAEAPSSELASPITLSVEYQAINAEIAEEDFVLSIPASYSAYDSVQDLVKPRETNQWSPQRR